MKLATIQPAPEEIVENPKATWNQVKYWAELAAKFQHASLAAQVMAGFSLMEIRKTYSAQGKRTDQALSISTSPHDAGKLGWEETVKLMAGISDDTARRWMAMADAIKARWKKLAPQARLKELMKVSPDQWTDADTKLITEALHKVTDGQTQLDFMRELGLAKAAPGNPHAKGTGSRKLTAEEQIAAARKIALEDSGRLGVAVDASNKNFFLLCADNDVELDRQISVLEFGLKLRHKYRHTPKAKRNDELVAELQKLIAADSPFQLPA